MGLLWALVPRAVQCPSSPRSEPGGGRAAGAAAFGHLRPLVLRGTSGWVEGLTARGGRGTAAPCSLPGPGWADFLGLGAGRAPAYWFTRRLAKARSPLDPPRQEAGPGPARGPPTRAVGGFPASLDVCPLQGPGPPGFQTRRGLAGIHSRGSHRREEAWAPGPAASGKDRPCLPLRQSACPGVPGVPGVRVPAMLGPVCFHSPLSRRLSWGCRAP